MALKIDTKKFFEVLVISFIAIEAVTYILSQFNLGVSLLTGGWIIFLFLLAILLTTLWSFGQNINNLKPKDFIFMLFVLVVLVALYFILPMVIPQIFTIIPGQNIRNFLVQGLGSLQKINIGSGIV